MGSDEYSKEETTKKDLKEVDTGHAYFIPETAADKLYNSIVRIEKENKLATGFFIKIEIKHNVMNFLVTCDHVIGEKDVNANKNISIYYGKKNYENKKIINLEKNKRFIKCFPGPEDVTVIEILENDNIPENKYLMPDLNYLYGYEQYINGNFYLAGYPEDLLFKKERHISSGKISKINVNKINFYHTIDTRHGSSGSPICTTDFQRVVGIHCGGSDESFKNKGTFIGLIIDSLNNVRKDKIIENINNYKKKIYLFEDYGEIFELHRIISQFYYNQSEENYNINMNGFNECYQHFAYSPDVYKFFNKLDLFKNVNNYEHILNELIKDESYLHFNFFLNHWHKDNQKKEKYLRYFLAGFFKVLYDYNKYNNIGLKKNLTLYYKESMDESELLEYRTNINRIICVKEILKTYSSKEDCIKNIDLNDNHFKIIMEINYCYKYNWYPSCFDVSKFYSIKNNEKIYIFGFFSFFKIENVIMNEFRKEAVIKLKVIGKKEIFEEKMEFIDNCNDISLNKRDDTIELI